MILEIKKRFRRPVGFRFDALAAFLLCQQYGVDLGSMDKIPKEDYVSSWVWSAHRSFCMLRYKQPMAYKRMKRYIAQLRKSDWDLMLTAMSDSRAPEAKDKKKVEAGGNSSSQDGQQE